MKYPKLPNACSERGCSMGRDNGVHEPELWIKFRLYKMPMSGDYDSGGAYWGSGKDIPPMWHAYGDGAQFNNWCYVRARDRGAAKAEVRKHFKHALFYR
jgi:hypothetical protein